MIIDYPIEEAESTAVQYEAQSRTDAQRIQAQQNLGFTLNEAGELEVITENGPKRILLVD